MTHDERNLLLAIGKLVATSFEYHHATLKHFGPRLHLLERLFSLQTKVAPLPPSPERSEIESELDALARSLLAATSQADRETRDAVAFSESALDQLQAALATLQAARDEDSSG